MTTAEPSSCLYVVTEAFGNAVDISGTPGNYQFSGPVVTVLHIIEQHLGLCFQLMRSRHRVYGHRQPNGSWTGIIGLLQRQEVDFAGTLFVMTAERHASLDFSEPFYVDEYNTLYIRPGVTADVTSFIKPYSAMVWLLVLLTTVMVFSVSQGVLRGTNLLYKSHRDFVVCEDNGPRLTSGEKHEGAAVAGPDKSGEPLMAVERSAILTWGILLSQSVPLMPSEGLARGVAALWLLVSFTLGSVYRSNLKAMIIYPRVHLPFSSLEELGHSNILSIVANASVIHTHIMDSDNSSSLGKLKDQLQVIYIDQKSSALQEIFAGRRAGITFTMAILSTFHVSFSMTGKCSVYTMSRGFLGPLSLSLAFPKGSALRRDFNQIIMRLRESGILAKLFSDGLVNATMCATPLGLSLSDVKERPFQLKDFYGVFLIHAVGLLLAAEAFLGELVRGGRWSLKQATVQ